MRHAVLLSIFLLFLPISLCAQTKYVSEVREITLRTGPGVDYKIIEMIKSGTPMTVLEETGDWTRIQIGDDKDGWVLSRFLQNKVPDSVTLKKLQGTYSALKDEADTLKEENRALMENSEKLTAELSQCRNGLDALNTAHETLKNESADFLELQADHKKAMAELSEQREKVGQLENELSNVYSDKRMNWFLIGAGVLLIGIIIGFITKPQRRRSVLR